MREIMGQRPNSCGFAAIYADVVGNSSDARLHAVDGLADIFGVGPRYVDARGALDTAEEGVGIDLA